MVNGSRTPSDFKPYRLTQTAQGRHSQFTIHYLLPSSSAFRAAHGRVEEARAVEQLDERAIAFERGADGPRNVFGVNGRGQFVLTDADCAGNLFDRERELLVAAKRDDETRRRIADILFACARVVVFDSVRFNIFDSVRFVNFDGVRVAIVVARLSLFISDEGERVEKRAHAPAYADDAENCARRVWQRRWPKPFGNRFDLFGEDCEVARASAQEEQFAAIARPAGLCVVAFAHLKLVGRRVSRF